MQYVSHVIKGKGVGKTLGFPTLNLVIPQDFAYPHGIYGGWVFINRQKYQGAFHFGPVPVFDNYKVSLEVFILDQDLSETPVEIEFELVQKIRDVMNFKSQKVLAEQIEKDVEQVREILNTQ